MDNHPAIAAVLLEVLAHFGHGEFCEGLGTVDRGGGALLGRAWTSPGYPIPRRASPKSLLGNSMAA